MFLIIYFAKIHKESTKFQKKYSNLKEVSERNDVRGWVRSCLKGENKTYDDKIWLYELKNDPTENKNLLDNIKIENIKKTIEKSVGVDILSMVIFNTQNESTNRLDKNYNKFLELHNNTIYCDFNDENEDYEKIFLEINKFIEIQNI